MCVGGGEDVARTKKKGENWGRGAAAVYHKVRVEGSFSNPSTRWHEDVEHHIAKLTNLLNSQFHDGKNVEAIFKNGNRSVIRKDNKNLNNPPVVSSTMDSSRILGTRIST